jgi:hypothetical protein
VACTAKPLNTKDNKTCKVTLKETQLLRSEGPAKVTANPDGASRTVWVVTALDRTGDAGVVIKVLDVVDEGARHEESGMFTVVVANSLPVRSDKLAPPPGIKLNEHDWMDTDKDFAKQPANTYYYTHAAGLESYFKDSDASDGIDFTKANVRVSDPAHVIVRHVDTDGANIYFDVVEEGSDTTRQNFTITVFAQDKAKAVSAETVEIQYEWPAPRKWNYEVEQNRDGGFQTRPVGLRKGVSHTLMFSKYETAPADANLLRLLDKVVVSGGDADVIKELDDAATETITGYSSTLDLEKPSDPTSVIDNAIEIYLAVTGSGVVKNVGDLTPVAPGTDHTADEGTVSFEVDRTGRGTITFVVKAWYTAKKASAADWHDIASTKRTLHLDVSHVGAGTTTYALQ